MLAKVTPTDENAGYLVVHGVYQHINKVDTLDSHRQTCINADIMCWWLVPFHWTWPSYWVCSVESESVQEEKRLCRVRARFHCLVISISDLPILQHLVQIIDQWANMALLCTLISSE